MYLPQELVDSIIDHIHDDIGTLQICSTVCRAWLPAAQFHLLEHVSVETYDQLESLQQSSAPLLNTKKLTLHGRLLIPEIIKSSCWSRFIALDQMSLKCLRTSSIEVDTMLGPFFDNFSLLKSLHITRAYFRSLHTLMRLIHSLPNLSRLELKHTTWGLEARSDRLFLGSFPPIRHLHLQLLQLGEFVEYICTLHPVLSLQLFTVGNIGTVDFGHEALLASCHASLTTLDLRGSGQAYHERLDLQDFEALSTIILPHMWLPSRVFTTVRSQKLRTILSDPLPLHIRGDPMYLRNSTYPWGTLDEYLEADLFRRASLMIVFRPYEPSITFSQQTTDIVAQMLPKCASRGILRVGNAVDVYSELGIPG